MVPRELGKAGTPGTGSFEASIRCQICLPGEHRCPPGPSPDADCDICENFIIVLLRLSADLYGSFSEPGFLSCFACR
jgi:hypothetical protein